MLSTVFALRLLACAQSDATERDDAGQPDSRDDAGARDAGPDIHYKRCQGEPFGQGTCEDGQLCGSLPEVGYDYCLPAVPCPPDMVSVLNAACAYPCAAASDCEAHGLRACAANTLATITGEAYGWCTP